ncbi:checkpoint protein Hus1/Mec3 [Sporodiniella umbellata]|nr:checkpoint protein Hus1/Mec3 [Sporodiniella umbellata]
MRFKASVNNPVGFYKISQTLEKIGPTAIISLSLDAVSFIRHRDLETGIQAWIKVQPHSLFTNYRVEESRSGEINMFFRVKDLLAISKVAQRAADIQVYLKKKDNRPYISWTMQTEDRTGAPFELIKELDVEVIPSNKITFIKEPIALAMPHTYILLPNVHVLKPIADRFKSISKYLTLSANMDGKFKISTESHACECEAVYEGLENPRLEGHVPTRDPFELAQVRIASEDFVGFLSCHFLEPQNVICAITDEMQLALYVYLSLDSYQTHEAPIQPINSPQTILTCHVPIHYE